MFTKFHIHFVCYGNTFRSRLAQSYLNSKKIPKIKATSSGTHAEDNFNGPISWYTLRILKNNNLLKFDKDNWDKTTIEILNQADLNIFIPQKNYEFCIENLNYAKNNYQIWNILDLDDLGYDLENLSNKEKEYSQELLRIKQTDKIYDQIKNKVDELILQLNKH